MHLHDWFVTLSLLLTAGGTIPYLMHLRRGTGKISRTSWIIWTSFNSIACLATTIGGQTSWQLVVIALSNLAILLYGWNRSEQSERVGSSETQSSNWSRLDKVCLSIGAAGILVWLFTQDPLWGVVIGLTVNTIALYPTAVKTWGAPRSEAPWGYTCMVAACGFMLLAQTITPNLLTGLPAAVYGTTSALMLGMMLMSPNARKRARTLSIAIGCLGLGLVMVIMNILQARRTHTSR